MRRLFALNTSAPKFGQKFSNQKKLDYRFDVQVLRGFAVLSVVLFHSGYPIFSNGYLGVDVFFVISGFVVTPLILRMVAEKNDFGTLSSLLNFYLRRFLRLAPALFVVLIISALLIFLLASPSDHQRFARQGLFTIALVGNIGAYKYFGDYFSPHTNPLLHTWSLAVEEQFYLIYPFLFLIANLITKRAKLLFMLAFAAMMTASFYFYLMPDKLYGVYSFLKISNPELFGFYSPVSRFYEFGAGSFIFFISKKYPHVKGLNQSYRMNLVPVGLMIAIFFVPLELTRETLGLLSVAFTCWTISTHSLDLLPKKVFRVLGWVGDRSYSIYLIHLPVFYLQQYSPYFSTASNKQNFLGAVGAFFVTLGLSQVLYSRIEVPFKGRKQLSRKFLTSKVKSISCMIVGATLLFTLMIVGEPRLYFGLERTVQSGIYPASLDPKCERDSVSGGPCLYVTSNSVKTVLLLGDSHAGHLSEALVAVARENDWNAVIWTHSSCPVIQETMKIPIVSQICRENNASTLEWIKTHKPDLVVVSQYIQREIPVDSYVRPLRNFSAVGARVLLIGNNPIFPDVDSFMVRRAITQKSYVPPKSFDVSEMNLEDHSHSSRVLSSASKSGISTFDPWSLFCDYTVCTRYENSNWLYFDTHHLTVLGAEKLKAKIMESL